MAQLALVVALVLAGVLVLFGAQNTEPVTLHFLWLSARAMPLSLAILGGAVIGALLTFMVGLPSHLHGALTGGALKRQSARQKTKIAQLQEASITAEETAPHPAP